MELTRTADDVGSMERVTNKDDIGRSLALQKGEFSELIGGEAPRLTGEGLDGGAWVAPTIRPGPLVAA